MNDNQNNKLKSTLNPNAKQFTISIANKRVPLNIKELDLSNLNLTSIPESISLLTALTSLNLSYNNLIVLPDSFYKLTNLTSLNLSFNPELSTIPFSIGCLKNLKVLDLTGLVRLKRLETIFFLNPHLHITHENIINIVTNSIRYERTKDSLYRKNIIVNKIIVLKTGVEYEFKYRDFN